MQVKRLDDIIKNNVTYSMQKNNQEQMVYILQDISATIAMIYDHLCGHDPVSEASEPVASMAYVIPLESLANHTTMHFETIDYPQGYEIEYVSSETYETIDAKNNEYRTNTKFTFNAFGDELTLDSKSYGKKWRCWNVKPTEEERKKVRWEK